MKRKRSESGKIENRHLSNIKMVAIYQISLRVNEKITIYKQKKNVKIVNKI